MQSSHRAGSSLARLMEAYASLTALSRYSAITAWTASASSMSIAVKSSTTVENRANSPSGWSTNRLGISTFSLCFWAGRESLSLDFVFFAQLLTPGFGVRGAGLVVDAFSEQADFWIPCPLEPMESIYGLVRLFDFLTFPLCRFRAGTALLLGLLPALRWRGL